MFMSNIDNNGVNKTVINWFPGHMTKARREMEKRIQQVDCIIELRDARAVRASHNPLIDELRGNKPLLIVLTKKDKADEYITEQWVRFFQSKQIEALALNLTKDNILNKIDKKIALLMQEKHKKQLSRGIKPRATRAMVTGIPNVGKSTFINRVNEKKVLHTGNLPGVTRSLKLIKVNERIELMDTPGLLWQKFEDDITGLHLALTNSIAERVLPLDEVLQYAYERLSAKDEFHKHYGFAARNLEDFLVEFAKTRKFHLNHDGFDIELAKKAFLKDIQDGKIGRYSWELLDESI